MSEATETKYQVVYAPGATKPKKAPNPAYKGDENDNPEIEVAPAYGGTITMRLPTWEQRLQFMESIGADAENPGGQSKGLDLVAHLAPQVPGFVVSVQLVRLADGLQLTTWDDVRHEGDLAQSTVPEMAVWLIGKHNIGTPSVPS